MRVLSHHLPPRSRARGFTLLELVLVMLLLTTILAMAAPSLRGFAASSRSRDAATQFVALTQYARARAAADARVYRLNVDAADNAYYLTVQDGLEFVRLGNDFGRVFSLPANTRLDLTTDRGGTTIDFHPDGRGAAAVIRLVDLDRMDVTTIASMSPAEPFRVLPTGEGVSP